jgi:hypothetical protein
MFGSDRGRLHSAVTASVVVIVACLSLLCAYSLGVINSNYTKRASDYSEHYAENAKDYIEKQCLGLEGIRLQECIKGVVEATRESQRSEYDLSAQEAMAEWAFWMLVTSSISFIIGAIGIWFVALTLMEARKTTRAAFATLHANRAWVLYDNIDFIPANGKMKGVEMKQALIIRIWLRNTGLSPATNVYGMADLQQVGEGESVPIFEFKRLPDLTGIVGQDKPVSLSATLYDEMLERFMSRQCRTFVYVGIAYFDVFEPTKERMTEVCAELTYNGELVNKETGEGHPNINVIFFGPQNIAT